MKSKTLLTVILAIVLVSCAPASISTPTKTVIPIATLTLTPVPPTPTITPIPPLESLPVTQESVSQFANAMQKAGINITAEQILQQGLTIKDITGMDGKEYRIATTSDGYVLLIGTQNLKTGNWEWSGDTLKPVLNNMLGVSVGAGVNTSDPFKLPIYTQTLTNNFNLIFADGDFAQNTLEKWGKGKANFMVNFAQENDLALIIMPGFNRYDQAYLENIDPSKRLDRLKERARTILSFVKKGQKQPTYVTMFNEPFSRYISGSGKDVVGWKVESLAYQTMKDDTIIDTYVMFYEAAQEQGLEIGKDVFFMFNEYGINTDNPKYHKSLIEFKRAKVEIAKRLGISVDEVKFGLGLQQRYDEKNPYDLPDENYAGTGHVRPVTEQELETTTAEFLKIVDFVIFTECTDIRATPAQRQIRFETLLQVAKKLGVKQIIFENPLRFTYEEPDQTYEGTDLFTPEYKKSIEYYYLVRDAFDLATQN